MSPGEIVSPAREPGAPEGFPAPLIAVAIGIVLLTGGVVLALVKEHLDTRVWTADDVEALGLGSVYGPTAPWHPSLRGTDAEDVYRLALSSLPLDGAARPIALLGTHGPVSPGLAAGLARAVFDTGRSVTLVVADPDDTDGADRAGLSDALLDGGPPDATSLLREVAPGLWLMGAGRQAAELPALVQRPVFTDLVESLAAGCDLLIVVGPDARTATGTAIARSTGAGVLVVTVARTTRPALLGAARLLEENDARILGVLLADRPDGERRRARHADRVSIAALLSASPSAGDGEDGKQPSAATPDDGAGRAAGERLRAGGGT